MVRQAEGAVRREALRVFRRLAGADAYLSPVGTPSPGWGVFVPRNGHRAAVMTVDGPVVSAWRARDWLDEDARGRCRLSTAGLAWYRRMLAGGETANEVFRRQHQLIGTRMIEEQGHAGGRVTVNEAESPLGWLRRRKGTDGKPLINDAQYEAGERLRRDFTVAGLSPRLTSNWTRTARDRRRRSGPGDNTACEIQDRALAARQRYFRALERVGPELADILVEVCCLANGIEAAERSLGWPQRSGKIVLQLALTRLARHYGLLACPAGTPAPSRIRHWGRDGFRPSIEGDGEATGME